MRTLIIVAIAIVIGIRAVDWFWSPPNEGASHADVLVTVQPTVTPMPPPTPTLAQLGEPVRVQFPRGTYGTSINMSTAQTTYILWARAGQTLHLTSDQPFAARLSAPGGEDLPLTTLAATLPASGDYLLTVAGAQAFTFSIDIR